MTDGAQEDRGFAYLFSYSGYLILEPDARLPTLELNADGHEVILYPPMRLAPQCWRPIPLIDENAVRRLFQGDDLAGLPLQVTAIPAIGADGTPALTLLGGRGGEYEPSLPADTLLLWVLGADENYDTEVIAQRFVNPFLLWLRILTRQWWIGRSTEKQTGNLHFTFEMYRNGRVGEFFAPRCRQTAPDERMELITADVWQKAFRAARDQEQPPWEEVMLSDVFHYRSNKEFLTAILLVCGWVEAERDITLERRGIKLSSLGVSATDMLKQVSVGFGKCFGRNMKVELPIEFELLRSFWRSRGEFAHGRPLRWEFAGQSHLGQFEEFSQHLGAIRDWFHSVREHRG